MHSLNRFITWFPFHYFLINIILIRIFFSSFSYWISAFVALASTWSITYFFFFLFWRFYFLASFLFGVLIVEFFFLFCGFSRLIFHVYISFSRISFFLFLFYLSFFFQTIFHSSSNSNSNSILLGMKIFYLGANLASQFWTKREKDAMKRKKEKAKVQGESVGSASIFIFFHDRVRALS